MIGIGDQNGNFILVRVLMRIVHESSTALWFAFGLDLVRPGGFEPATSRVVARGL